MKREVFPHFKRKMILQKGMESSKIYLRIYGHTSVEPQNNGIRRWAAGALNEPAKQKRQ
jgi:hypothetical protein